jgi:hypothetical protein
VRSVFTNVEVGSVTDEKRCDESREESGVLVEVVTSQLGGGKEIAIIVEVGR